MGDYFLAVDIGASSGRHILGSVESGKIVLEEIYRFENGMKHEGNSLLWDTGHLFDEIVNGLKKCKDEGKIPVMMGIDTWGVDYVLLDENDEVAGRTYGYRDHRTDGYPEKVYEIIPEKELYAHTGTQKQVFNTIFQLSALKDTEPEVLDSARTMLMMPDYFGFRLTGVKKQEYTNATTTGLINAKTNDWDKELIKKLELPERIFLSPEKPGTTLGNLKPEIQEAVGFDLTVMIIGSHDTASAVMSVPSTEDDTLYISSGTWSLMGVENPSAVTTDAARDANFTNEGGYDYRYRFLKNIMGLWMIQQVRHELNDGYSFAELCDMAEKEKEFPSRVEANAPRFLSPDNMQDEIKKAIKESGQKEPENVGQMATVIYQSLAEAYAETLKEIESITGKHYEAVNIIGGGSKAAYLNQLTANACKRKVIAGPDEGTAIGNLMCQMIGSGVFRDLKDARESVARSFDIKSFEPNQ
ncbi:MAG: rhamnulokinase [Lachnospiraceae bacterium]|nr:rhamnulokinase [Lachnospiraceae bacterium]MBQ9607007.1 rhamnulokinase [Lachnospiraceae bacterium]